MVQRKKKILFMSISAGQGHHSACRAAMEALSGRDDVRCAMLDTLMYVNKTVGKSVDRGYEWIIRVLPDAFGSAFRSAMKVREPGTKEWERGQRGIERAAELFLSEKLIRYVQIYNPDIIVSPHVFASIIITGLRKHGITKARTVLIITDYVLHPWVEYTETDYYILAAPQLKYQATRRGIPEEKIIATGIPVHPSFSLKKDKRQARRELLWDDKLTILIMGGSMGYGTIKEIIREIDRMPQDFQIVSVCGKNKHMYDAIAGLELRHKLFNYGFTDKVSDMMDAADILLTKPGGLTSSEALEKKVPMVLFSPIHGQEDYNLEFFLNNGVAMHIPEYLASDEVLHMLLENPQRMDQMRQAQESLGIGQASRKLADFLMSLPAQEDEARENTSN